jgi:hypothetical protein
VMPVPMVRGLVLFGVNEDAFAGPVCALGEIYGGELELSGPRVRMLPGKPPQQPIMHVRVATHRATMWQVLQELRSRKAHILEECVRDRLAVIRASAPQSLLVGLPTVLHDITSGDARCVIRLDRYEPMGGAFG